MRIRKYSQFDYCDPESYMCRNGECIPCLIILACDTSETKPPPFKLQRLDEPETCLLIMCHANGEGVLAVLQKIVALAGNNLGCRHWNAQEMCKMDVAYPWCTHTCSRIPRSSSLFEMIFPAPFKFLSASFWFCEGYGIAHGTADQGSIDVNVSSVGYYGQVFPSQLDCWSDLLHSSAISLLASRNS